MMSSSREKNYYSFSSFPSASPLAVTAAETTVMRPNLQTGLGNNETAQTNGHVKHEQNVNGKEAPVGAVVADKQGQTGDRSVKEEKVVLPNEMASMVPLQLLIGKVIRKAHADLMTLTDTLPSRSEVDKKRQILNYAIFFRQQILKLQVLVKWADNADDIQMCQNIMAFLANQNQIFRDTTMYLHKIHSELPAARIRNFDILSAVDVLTTGTYQRMPSKYKDMLPPTPLTDGEVLETFRQMNDVIRMRILTSEVLPAPMQNYEIESGRISFSIKNEFNVALTLMGPPKERRWWIVSLDILVKSTAGSGVGDVDISLNDIQRHNLRINAQKQLVPPIPLQPTPSGSDAQPENSKKPLFFPLINLYDYLHLFCLNMQLEIIFMQATMISRTRWLEQLRVEMDNSRTKLTLTYWEGGSAAAHWAHPQLEDGKSVSEDMKNSTTIEISVTNESEKTTGPFSPEVNFAIAVRDELKGLIQKSGLGASVALMNVDDADKPKLYTALKYPKNNLDVFWGGSRNLHSDTDLLNPSDLNIERLLRHVTRHHALCIISKIRDLLKSQESYLNENGLYLTECRLEDLISDDEASNEDGHRSEKNGSKSEPDDLPSLIVQYRHRRYISINIDMRTGRTKVREAGYRLGEGDVKLRELEELLNNDPANIAKHLLWLRSEVVIREIISLAKQLSLQPFQPSQMSLRPDDFIKLYGDLPSIQKPAENKATPYGQQQIRPMYPSHCVFLQFAQFEDWYLVIAIVRNEVHSWLCCINKTYDQNGFFQIITDLIHVNYDEMWKEHYIPAEHRRVEDDIASDGRKRRRQDREESMESNMSITDEHIVIEEAKKKRRRTLSGECISSSYEQVHFEERLEAIDNLSIDLRFMAKLDSLCRAYITNRKLELQLLKFKASLSYTTRPLLKSLPTAEAQVVNHPAAGKMEVLCVPQKDLLQTCAIRNIENDRVQHPKDIPLHIRPWLSRMLPQMRNDVVMRASGWWACGRSECFVVIQDKFDWRNIPLQVCDNSDHISLDKTTNVLSFTYTEIDTCIDRFLTDWERIYMMANLARQVSSKWLEKYKGELSFGIFNTQEFKFQYAKNFTCSIRWDAPSKSRTRQYIVHFSTTTTRRSSQNSNSNNRELVSLPLFRNRNPHWRIASFLQEELNEKRDLVYFVQILFQTLPLMACLEKLEMDFMQEGAIGEVSIIPRATQSVRIVYSSMHALDIRFTNPHTICVSDAAFHHIFYSSQNRTDVTQNAENIVPPQPYIASSTTTSNTQQDTNSKSETTVKPFNVAQQLKFSPFKKFDETLESMESWIFAEVDINSQPWYLSGKMWADNTEPFAVAFKHGMLCSASLCRNLFSRLKELL